jgi:hypothetical protein
VNIGLHYVAAASYQLPLDSDGDGVPDYVEAEYGTDINNAMTDGVTNDTYNVAYDDVDLSGNGLVGRIKKALGLQPLDPNNPLTLKQVITGEEPDIATFEVPLSYDMLTNIGSLNLKMNGITTTMNGVERATNGNTHIYFAITFDPAGQHYLQAQLTIDTGAWQEGAVRLADSSLLPFYSTNILQFFENNSMFDDTSAYLDAKLFVSSADYTIDLYDTSTTPRTWIMSITNSTSSEMIQEEWGMTNADGSPFTGNEIEAYYNVFPQGTFTANSMQVEAMQVRPMNAGGGGNSPQGTSRTLTRATNSLSEWGPNFDVMYMYSPENHSFDSSFSKGGSFWTGMQGMVDTLIAPRWTWSVYQSYFNRYLPDSHGEYPGYIASMYDATNKFLPDLGNGATRNLFTYTHGSPGALQNRDGDIKIYAADVQRVLGNYYDSKAKKFITPNPYRFVFLDGCDTASDPLWRRTFGIYPLGISSRGKVGPQAFVGWAKERTAYANTQERLTGYTATLQDFYRFWMSGQPLANCIKLTSDKKTYGCPLPVPGNERVIQNGVGTEQITSPIYVIGHSGLAVDRLIPQFDNLYASPKK